MERPPVGKGHIHSVAPELPKVGARGFELWPVTKPDVTAFRIMKHVSALGPSKDPFALKLAKLLLAAIDDLANDVPVAGEIARLQCLGPQASAPLRTGEPRDRIAHPAPSRPHKTPTWPQRKVANGALWPANAALSDNSTHLAARDL